MMRVKDRIMISKMTLGENMVIVILIYAPQSGLDESKNMLK